MIDEANEAELPWTSGVFTVMSMHTQVSQVNDRRETPCMNFLLGVRIVCSYNLFLAGCLPPWDSLPISGCYVFGEHNERKTDVKGATQLC